MAGLDPAGLDPAGLAHGRAGPVGLDHSRARSQQGWTTAIPLSFSEGPSAQTRWTGPTTMPLLWPGAQDGACPLWEGQRPGLGQPSSCPRDSGSCARGQGLSGELGTLSSLCNKGVRPA